MALDSLTAKANTGEGTDALGGRTVGGKFVGAAMLTDETGAEISAANPLDVSVASLPLPTGAATQATLAAIDGYFKAEDSAAVTGDKGLPLLGMRQSADTTSTDADGDYTLLKVDEEGRLKVGSKPASYPDITGDITTTQPVISTPVAGGTVEGDVSRASNLMIFCTGTFSTINCTFEGSLESSGATNWFAIQAVRSNANTIELTTGNLSAQPAYAWELSVNALKRFRVRATARTSGTQSWRFVQGTYATEPIPAAQTSATQPVSGTVTATVGTSITGGTISPLTVTGSSALASAARTTSSASGNIVNASGRSVNFFMNVTAASGGTPNLVVKIQLQEPITGAFIDMPGAAFAAVTGTGLSLLQVTNLQRNFQIVWTITGSTPIFTFSVGMAPVI